MLEEGRGRPKKKNDPRPTALAVPDSLRSRLTNWVDVEEVGADGFWRWLETILPLLPAGVRERPLSTAESGDRLRELAKDLVDCAGDRARLTVSCEQYYSDNQVLSRRVKALEATLKTVERAGQAVEAGGDEEAGEVSERYLPNR